MRAILPHLPGTRGFGLALGVLATLAYGPGLVGPFVFDDFPNIVLPLQGISPSWDGLLGFVISGQSGPLGRPLSLASFALNYLLGGLSPFGFKATNLAIHLVNAALVFAVARALLRYLPPMSGPAGRVVPSAVAALWLLHPIHLTSVLYVVQRMTSLSSTFVLLGVLAYLRARRAQLETRRLAGWSLGLLVPTCLLAATLAKESGVLLVAYLTAIEVSLLRFRTNTGAQAQALSAFYGAFLIAPLLLAAAFLFVRPGFLQGEELLRGFTLQERVMTEARVLWFYVRVLLLPVISDLGLYHDDFPLSTSLLEPATTLPAVLGWGLALVAALAGRNRFPLFCLAVTWYLAGHALESTVLLLQPVQLHRNYLAMLGPLLAFVVGVARLGGASSPRGAALLLLAWALTLAGVTAVRAGQWQSSLAVATFEVVHHPASPKANYDAARVLAEIALAGKQPELLSDAHRYFRRAAELDPNDVGSLLAIWTSSDAPLPQADYRALLGRLAQRPLFGPDIAYLRNWLQCRKLTRCVLPADQVLPVFDTILQHPSLAADSRANVLALLALYRADNLRDLSGAIELLQEAARAQPRDPVYQLNLAQAFLFLPDYDGAEAALALAKELDPLGRERSRRRKLEADLATFRAAARKPEHHSP